MYVNLVTHDVYILQVQSKDKARLPHHNYVEDYDDKDGSSSVVFSLSERVGALAEALKIFQVSIQTMVFMPVHENA